MEGSIRFKDLSDASVNYHAHKCTWLPASTTTAQATMKL